MALADNKLQQIGLALSYFGDAANQLRGVQSNFGGQNLHQLQTLQRQLLLQQELKKQQARESAQSEVFGGFDPSSGITWNTGRQVSGLVRGDLPMQGPLPAGIAEKERPTVPGMAFDPELAAEGRASNLASMRAAFPEQFAEAQVKNMFRDPKDNFIAGRFGLADVSDPENPKLVIDGTGGGTDDLINVADRQNPSAVPRGMSKKSAAALIASNPDRYVLAGTFTADKDGEPLEQVYDAASPTGSRLVPRSQAVGVAPPSPGRQGPQQLENTLRDEFNALSKPYGEYRSNYAKIQAAQKADTPAGDISMIFAYMKMLDPGSVVRENEYATAQNAAGVPDQVRNMFNRALDGTRLTADQRQDFADRANDLFQVQQPFFEALRTRYTDIAKRQNLNPENVVTDIYAGAGSAAQPVGRPRAQNPAGKVIEWDGSAWVPVN